MKPTGKPSLTRQQILAALLDNKHLAQNVSWQSIDVIAKRWLA